MTAEMAIEMIIEVMMTMTNEIAEHMACEIADSELALLFLKGNVGNG